MVAFPFLCESAGESSVPLHALGNVFQRLARPGIAAFLHRQVADRYDADQAVVGIDHGQPADLVLAHQLGNGRSRHVGGRAHHVVALDVLYGAVEVAVGDGTDHDVAVGHDADHATILDHRDRARVLVAHDARRDLDVVARRHRLGIGGHHVADLHRYLLVASADWTGLPRRRSPSVLNPGG